MNSSRKKFIVPKTDYSLFFKDNILDRSDYILLSTKYIKDSIPANLNSPEVIKLNDILNNITQLYNNLKYDVAIIELANALVVAARAGFIPSNVAMLILDFQANLKSIPEKNDSRRFYETELNNCLKEKIINSSSFLSVNKIIPVMLSFNPGLEAHLIKEIKTHYDSLVILTRVCMLNDNIELKLKEKSLLYPKKDRVVKEVEFNKKTNQEADVVSLNPGILKSLSPNYPTQLLSAPMVKKTVDNHRRDIVKNGYSTNHPDIPFVCSVSGTIFTLIVVLERLLKENTAQGNHDELQKHVNNIINSFISGFIDQGFHSMNEMLDVLFEPAIQAIFESYNIKITLDYSNEDLIKSYQQAQDYVFKISKDKIAQKEMLDKFKCANGHSFLSPVTLFPKNIDVTNAERKNNKRGLESDGDETVTKRGDQNKKK